MCSEPPSIEQLLTIDSYYYSGLSTQSVLPITYALSFHTLPNPFISVVIFQTGWQNFLSLCSPTHHNPRSLQARQASDFGTVCDKLKVVEQKSEDCRQKIVDGKADLSASVAILVQLKAEYSASLQQVTTVCTNSCKATPTELVSLVQHLPCRLMCWLLSCHDLACETF